MKWVCVLPLCALFSTVQGDYDPVCTLLGGYCQVGSAYCSGSSIPYMCGTSGDNRCCIPQPEPKCAKRGGRCQDTSVACNGGKYFTKLCSGPSSHRCCVPLGLGGCPIASQGLACRLLNNANIKPFQRHPGSGKEDNAYAYNNLRDMCLSTKAARSNYSCTIRGETCNAPGGATCLSYNVLDYLDQLAKGGPVVINELAGACHSCKSRHYSGLAVDLHKNGRQSEYLKLCQDLGGWKLNERNHVHCQFYDGEHPNWH